MISGSLDASGFVSIGAHWKLGCVERKESPDLVKNLSPGVGRQRNHRGRRIRRSQLDPSSERTVESAQVYLQDRTPNFEANITVTPPSENPIEFLYPSF